MADKAGKVYTLSDNKGNIFYVGATIGSTKSRFKKHISEAETGIGCNQCKNLKIASLNYEVFMNIIDEGETKEEVYKKEKYWIEEYSSLGHKLCNKHSRSIDLTKLREQNEVLSKTPTGNIRINAKQYALAAGVSHSSITNKLKNNIKLPYAIDTERFGNMWLIEIEDNFDK